MCRLELYTILPRAWWGCDVVFQQEDIVSECFWYLLMFLVSVWFPFRISCFSYIDRLCHCYLQLMCLTIFTTALDIRPNNSVHWQLWARFHKYIDFQLSETVTFQIECSSCLMLFASISCIPFAGHGKAFPSGSADLTRCQCLLPGGGMKCGSRYDFWRLEDQLLGCDGMLPNLFKLLLLLGNDDNFHVMSWTEMIWDIGFTWFHCFWVNGFRMVLCVQVANAICCRKRCVNAAWRSHSTPFHTWPGRFVDILRPPICSFFFFF